VYTTEVLLQLVANDRVQIWAQPNTDGVRIDYIAGAGGTGTNAYPDAPGIITNMYKLRE
jgi:hypothetical protein